MVFRSGSRQLGWRLSITLSPKFLRRLYLGAGREGSRSGVMERVLRARFDGRKRRKLHARDLECVNAAATGG